MVFRELFESHFIDEYSKIWQSSVFPFESFNMVNDTSAGYFSDVDDNMFFLCILMKLVMNSKDTSKTFSHWQPLAIHFFVIANQTHALDK